MINQYNVNEQGYYGEYGGAYIPEILFNNVEELKNNYLQIMESDSFKKEFDELLKNYVGRPTPLYHAKSDDCNLPSARYDLTSSSE